jgi:hypothetical protein
MPCALPTPVSNQGVPATLHEVASALRLVHLRLLQSTLGHLETTGSCLYACVLLQHGLQQFAEVQACVRGGDGVGDGGHRDPAGVWRGHYWVEAQDRAGTTWVVDITADQFGGPDVVVAECAVVACCYQPGEQAVVDDAVRDLLVT